jgi:hypothetical protein
MRSGGQNVPELMILPIYSQLPSDLQVGSAVGLVAWAEYLLLFAVVMGVFHKAG